jgi:hypothetical protein
LKNSKNHIVLSVLKDSSLLEGIDSVVARSLGWEQALPVIGKCIRSYLVMTNKLNEKSTDYEVIQSVVFLYNFAFMLKLYFPKWYKYYFGRKIWWNWFSKIVCNDETMTTKLIKYYYCCSSSIACDSALPKKPDGGRLFFPFSDGLSRQLKWRLSKGTKRCFDFVFDLNNSRKGSREVPEAFIEKSVNSYVEALTRPSSMSVPTEVEIAVEYVLRQFRPVSENELLGSLCKFVSTSACAERHTLGQVGYLYENSPKIDVKLTLDQKYTGICPVPYFIYGMVPDELTGKAVFLPEPLKVRAITTSCAFEFAAGKPYQDQLARRMKKNPNMLFGRMVEKEDINNLMARSFSYWQGRGFEKKDLVFVSGDYESATDNIDPSYSKYIDKKCFSLGFLPDFKLPSCELMPLWKIMAKIYEYCDNRSGPNYSRNNWININLFFKSNLDRLYPEGVMVSEVRAQQWSGRSIVIDKDTSIIQTFGQMMGDVKSFPVLCFLNLSLWSSVCDNRRVIVGKLKIEPPCLVNGDDFLAFAPLKYVTRYLEKAKQFGFTMSLGKTYISKRVAVINSRPFFVNFKSLKSIESVPVELHLLNVVQNQQQDLPFEGNIDLITDLCKPKERRLMFSKFILFNKSKITTMTRGGKLNLFIPRILGGIGAILRDGMVTKVSYGQKWAALYQIKRLELGILPERRLIQEVSWNYFSKLKKIIRIVNNNTTESLRKVSDGIFSSYKCSKRTRKLTRDNWLANISRVKLRGRGFYRYKYNDKYLKRLLKKQYGVNLNVNDFSLEKIREKLLIIESNSKDLRKLIAPVEEIQFRGKKFTPGDRVIQVSKTYFDMVVGRTIDIL